MQEKITIIAHGKPKEGCKGCDGDGWVFKYEGKKLIPKPCPQCTQSHTLMVEQLENIIALVISKKFTGLTKASQYIKNIAKSVLKSILPPTEEK